MKKDSFPDLEQFIEAIRQPEQGVFFDNLPIYINRCPGRLDLMGGNDDYTGGLVFETTIKETTIFAAQPRTDREFVLHNPSVKSFGWHDVIHFSVDDFFDGESTVSVESIRELVNADELSAWFTYIVGGIYYLCRNYPEMVTHGLNMYLDSNIPLGKGVSSSAALEVSALKACAAAYGIEIKGIDLAMATQWVECEISGAAAGIMDQYAVIMGNENCFTPMQCQPCISLPNVQLPKGIKIWGIDSGVRHAVSGTAYESARAACFMGYQFICEQESLPVSEEQQGPLTRFTDPRFEGYLARIKPTEFRDKYEDNLPESISGEAFNAAHAVHFDPYTRILPELDYPVRKATRYSVEENNRVNLFYQILKTLPENPDGRSLEMLGELMIAAHLGYTDCGLGCKETDLLIEMVKTEKMNDLFGAKITGGGAGGTIAILGRDTVKAEEAVKRIFADYEAQTGNSAWLFEGSTLGADAFGILKL